MITKLRRIVWYQYNEVDKKRANSGSEEGWGL